MIGLMIEIRALISLIIISYIISTIYSNYLNASTMGQEAVSVRLATAASYVILRQQRSRHHYIPDIIIRFDAAHFHYQPPQR